MEMADGGPQPAEGTAEVGEADTSIDQGGGWFPGLGPDILVRGVVGLAIWI